MMTWQNPLPLQADIYDVLHFAVAVPLVWHEDCWQLLFEVRSPKLKRNPGEVSFPGGRIEITDVSPLYAALREMKEELGTDESDWHVLGALPYEYTRHSRLVAPYVVLAESLPHLDVSQQETTAIFTVPWDWLYQTEPARIQMKEGVYAEADFPYAKLPQFHPRWTNRLVYEVAFFEYRGHVIWGLTARIICHFIEIVKKSGYVPGMDFRQWLIK